MEKMYKGLYRYSLEEKGRLFIPVKFRKGLAPEAEDTFVATRLYDKCITLFPLDEWREKEEKLIQLPQGDPRMRKLVRWICSRAEQLKLDSQGRINIPQHLLEYAELEKEVVIIGILNHIELWNPELYAKEEEESEPSVLGPFADLNI